MFKRFTDTVELVKPFKVRKIKMFLKFYDDVVQSIYLRIRKFEACNHRPDAQNVLIASVRLDELLLLDLIVLIKRQVKSLNENELLKLQSDTAFDPCPNDEYLRDVLSWAVETGSFDPQTFVRFTECVRDLAVEEIVHGLSEKQAVEHVVETFFYDLDAKTYPHERLHDEVERVLKIHCSSDEPNLYDTLNAINCVYNGYYY